jgi:aspartate aminotransferase/aminotransferase
MKVGKTLIHDLPRNEVTELEVYAGQLQAEASARGEVLPPAIRLHIGEPSFLTPEHIRSAAVDSFTREQLTYGPAAGWGWLRELLAQKIARANGYVVEPEHIAIAVGGTGAILAALLATVSEGDEVLIPDPCWPHYRLQLAVCGAAPVPYALDPQNGWVPDIAQLERLVTRRTRLLLINSPGNPTGAVYPARFVEDLLEFAQRHDLYIISDESYDEIIFEGNHVSPATLLSREEFEAGRCICVYSFSKTYAMTGWRLGYITAGKQLIQTITTVLDASSTNVSTVVQKAGAAALTGSQACVAEMRDAYQRRRDVALGVLKAYGRYTYTPCGAFYLLIDVGDQLDQTYSVYQFAFDLLLRHNVAVAPGSAFGVVARNHVRISLAASELDIERGVRELCAFSRSGIPLLEGHR